MNHLYRFLLFILSFSFGLHALAQDKFERRYPIRASNVITSSLEPVADKFAFVGIEINEDGENENLNFTLLDKKGTILSSRSIFYQDSIEIDKAGDVLYLSDGTYAVSVALAKDSLNKVISGFDNFGNELFTTITGSYTDTRDSSRFSPLLLEVPTERIFHLHAIDGAGGSTDLQLTGMSLIGEIEFVKNIALSSPNRSDLTEKALDWQMDYDQNIMLLGTTDDTEFPMFLTKMDTFGNVLWTKTYKGDFTRSHDSVGYNMVQLIDSTWAITGSVNGSASSGHDGFFMILDKEGGLLKTQSISTNNSSEDLFLNGIVGLLDTTVVISSVLRNGSDVIQPVIFKYDRDSTLFFQTVLDTAIYTDPDVHELVTGDSITTSFLMTTTKSDLSIPYLAKLEDDGSTFCEESTMKIQIDTIEFTDSSLAFSIIDTMIQDSIMIEDFGFSRYNPPILNLQDTLFCPQDPIFYVADATVRGGVFYMWEDGSTDSVRLLREEGMFMVTVTVREDICFTLCDTLTISQLDFPEVTISKDFGSYCSTGIGQLTANIMGAQIESFSWNTGATSSAITVDDTPMTYSVVVTDGCGNTATASTTVGPSDVSIPNPLGLVVSKEDLCNDGSLIIRSTLQADPSLISWSTGETNSLSIRVTGPGTYSADVSGFCPDSESIVLTPDDFIPPVDATIEFECSSPPALNVVGSGFSSQTWSTGQTTPSITITQGGVYSVVVQDSCGMDQPPLEITITDDEIDACTSCDNPCLKWPNALQPNNTDPINKEFGPFFVESNCDGLASFEMRIFNRWGKNIYTSTSVDDRWDGTVNGEAQPGGVYFYWARYNDGLTTCERQGDVTLLR